MTRSICSSSWKNHNALYSRSFTSSPYSPTNKHIRGGSGEGILFIINITIIIIIKDLAITHFKTNNITGLPPNEGISP